MVEQERYYYAVTECVFLVKNFYTLHADYKMLFDDFVVNFPAAPCLTCGYINKLHTKFKHTGSVLDAKCTSQPRMPEGCVKAHGGLHSYSVSEMY